MTSAYPGGYMGKVLRVDLSSGRISTETLEAKILRKYVGGTGMGVRYLYAEVPPSVDAKVGVTPALHLIAGGSLLASPGAAGRASFLHCFESLARHPHGAQRQTVGRTLPDLAGLLQASSSGGRIRAWAANRSAVRHP